jgi:hypothetical protein
MLRQYRYLGPAELAAAEGDTPPRRRITDAAQVRAWVAETGQSLDREGRVTATFVVDTAGSLWIADRHSEHVQCARGEPVLAAGELTFRVHDAEVTVVAATNQSTGYCPEPDCWDQVAQALDRARLVRPSCFTAEFAFRRCVACGSISIIKDACFDCPVCDERLPDGWNCGAVLARGAQADVDHLTQGGGVYREGNS